MAGSYTNHLLTGRISGGLLRGTSYLGRVVESGTGSCKGKGDDTDDPIAEKTIPNMETGTGPVQF